MKHNLKKTRLYLVYFLLLSLPLIAGPLKMSYTVSMGEPASHLYQVELVCEGISNDLVDFKLPAWTPGYYRLLDFADNVRSFSVQDREGHPLAWEKIGKNVWRVVTGDIENIKLHYQVYADGRSVAESSLDENKGFISPTGVFMYIAGHPDISVTVAIEPYKDFNGISTGLDSVHGRKNTFSAENFDILYDCPIFIDNQENTSFSLNGVQHNIAVYKPGKYDKQKLVSILKRMVQSAISIIGEIPYEHYTFIMMGRGMGGLEHSNSMAVFTQIPELEEPSQYNRWLSFIAHEFFHLYNVKRIRPIALGPFDYSGENRTYMLWLSEGGTVYYEYLILNRAGFMSAEDVLDRYAGIIKKYEDSPGNKTMPVSQASYETWTLPFFGDENTISYYDKGAGLCMLLDLKIRHETENKKSLDDVMRALYQKFYKDRGRGFTDGEFRQVCEETAGAPLDEFFDYVYTAKPIDYDKYLGYAGLKLELPAKEDEDAKAKIAAVQNPDELQQKIFQSWLE